MEFDKSKRLYRSRTDRMVAGVAGGIADYFGIDPTIVRILWALAFLAGGFPGLVSYVLAWIVIPLEPPHDERPTGDRNGAVTSERDFTVRR